MPRRNGGAVHCGVVSLQDVYDDEEAGLDQASRLRTVQAALLPDGRAGTGWSAAHVARAAAGVSGDLAQCATAPDGRSLVVTVGDVMGKGVPAGLLAAHLLGALDALVRETPGVAVEGAEGAVRGRLERASAFATLFHARLRLADGALEFVDAGHGFAAIARTDGSTRRIPSADLPIGLQPRGFPRLPRHDALGPGDVLLVASDGILELPDADFETLTALARRLVDAPALDDTLRAFLDDVPAVVGDDLTVLAVRRDVDPATAAATTDPDGADR